MFLQKSDGEFTTFLTGVVKCYMYTRNSFFNIFIQKIIFQLEAEIILQLFKRFHCRVFLVKVVKITSFTSFKSAIATVSNNKLKMMNRDLSRA